jgi:hypothetical protein
VTPEITPEVTLDPTVTEDPRTGGGGSAIWTEWSYENKPLVTSDPNGFPLTTPEPTPSAEPAPSGPVPGDSGLAVVDPAPDLNLVDTIVGGVVSSYFGQ